MPITHYLRTNVWITTSANVSPVSLTGALTAPGADRILFATDSPIRPWACVSAHPRKRDPEQSRPGQGLPRKRGTDPPTRRPRIIPNACLLASRMVALYQLRRRATDGCTQR